MRKTLIAGTAVALLVGSQLPAQAAGPGAPADVQVSWADVAKRTVKLTWTDNGEKNYIGYEIDGVRAGTLPDFEAAGGDNSVILTVGSGLTGQMKVRFLVWSEDAAGAVSAKTPTAWFDTLLSGAPVLTNAEILADLSLRLTQRMPSPAADTTPDDPLDLPSGVTFSVGRWTTNADQPTETFPVAAGSTTTTIPPRPRPYKVDFQSRNEWGSHTNYLPLTFAPMGAALKVDALTTFGQTTGFQINSGPLLCIAAGPSCPYTYSDTVITQIQSRANASQPWKTIGTWSKTGTKISGGVPAVGSTQYRVWVPAWKQLNPSTTTGITAAASTTARSSATQANVSFGLTKSTAQVGQVVQAVVSVKPAGGGTASLQWLDGKVWRTSAYIPLSKGKGTLSFKASGRGATRYWRIAVPQLTWYGKTIVPTVSAPVSLTVR
ncbi:hypothetical protein [Streptomyces sp. SID13031]|uniref:hypothetical protein n=1 Tax=Streptomyces sp. SID13031 TaxID=2706046 RepID=UPI0013C93DE2|nr:hypothetical protein [Streptomyces sp. SID13031]NEA31900.1 hypothetical protein [Streptomyces sp. SID13031]